ncbi:unnamed protein product [Penicillium camemberti]|uniref:Str. FM013 n=1 Tax=Penicillium camemberti (strain FM 013) TaxID=1429867 RepID=A0A0G4PLT8_PENC3|nr:unnamed protein product [Penicillium camemberti]
MTYSLTYASSPPGVGKIFTVEATSEYFKLPLYSLNVIFKIAKHFNAILLLDKADAFIKHDLRRLESLALNGREIKNIATIAYALAEADASQVSYKYLELAAESNKKFSKEFGRERPVDRMYV